MKKTLLTSLLIFTIYFCGFSQRFNYEKTSKFFAGLQIGYNWHTSDVKQVKPSVKFPVGLGVILGGSLNQDYGNFLSYDIRAKVYFGNWYGIDSDTTSAIKDNEPVNNLYQSLGYTVQNFKSTQVHTALELAVHFNRVKELSGIDPYFFGGIGFTFTNTRGNLVKNNQAYDYSKTSTGNILDKTYESELLKNDKGDLYDHSEVNILPSLGFGIGYYFNSSFSLGLEHTTTFFLGDYFDGTPLTQAGKASKPFKNDLYHFTSIYFRWYFRRHSRTHEKNQKTTPTAPPVTHSDPNKYDSSNRTLSDSNSSENNNQNSSTNQSKLLPPIVDFTNPSGETFTSSSPTFTLRANIENVVGSDRVKFTQNGANHTRFIYNPTTNTFESNVNLAPGANTFQLFASNAAGSAQDEVVIVYQRTPTNTVNPPVINIVSPASSPYTTNQLNYVVNAAIYNISSRNQLVVTLNDHPLSSYSFSQTNGINFSTNINLVPGANRLKIQGTNAAGSTEDQTVIIYSRGNSPQNIYPPEVKITTPNVSPYTTYSRKEQVVATLKYVDKKSQIKVKINQISTTNFTYNSTLHRLIYDADLYTGRNTIEISAVNPYGSGSDQVQIVLEKKVQKPKNLLPEVKITTPANNPSTIEDNSVKVFATTKNVSSRNEISVSVNGSPVPNFIFRLSKNQIEFTAELVKGNNTVEVKVNTTFGSASDMTKVIKKEKGTPPTVSIVTPNVEQTTTTKLTAQVIAELTQITGKNQIGVFVNGIQIYNFSYNPSTQRISFTANLSSSHLNTVKVNVTNPYGSATDEVKIQYKREPRVPKPTVYFTQPSSSGTTVIIPNYTVKAKVGNVTSPSGITVIKNGVVVPQSAYTFTAQSGLISYVTTLSLGKNTFVVKAQNTAGTAQATTNITRKELKTKKGQVILKGNVGNVKGKTPPTACGTMVDLQGANPAFCLIGSGGKVQADYLTTHTNYSYNGAAREVYFKAAKDGHEKVGTGVMSTLKGNYYYFSGHITVDLKYNRPGYERTWSVCITSQRGPVFGKGKTQPKNPCGSQTTHPTNPKGDNGKIINSRSLNKSKTPIIKGKKLTPTPSSATPPDSKRTPHPTRQPQGR